MKIRWLFAAGIAGGICLLFTGMAAAPQDGQDRTLATARLTAARSVTALAADKLRAGMPDGISTPEIEASVLWSLRIARAERDSGQNTARAAFTLHLARVQGILDRHTLLHKAGRTGSLDVAVAHYHVADAKWLLAQQPAK